MKDLDTYTAAKLRVAKDYLEEISREYFSLNRDERRGSAARIKFYTLLHESLRS